MALSHVHGVLLLRGSLARHAPTARFVRQSLDALRQKSLHPFVHKAPADPDRGSNGGDRSPHRRRVRSSWPVWHSPAETVVARCHASSVRRSAGVRVMVREVLRPRAIQRPCVIQVEPGTTWGPGSSQGSMCGKEDRDDISPPLPSHPSLRRQTVPGSRSLWCRGFVTRITIPSGFAIWASAQHGFVGQVWSGRVVGIRPTRCPLRPSVRRDEPEDRLQAAGGPTR